MNLKRSLLAIITAISLLSVVFALSQSLGEPQVQAQLELYQTNLLLNAAQIQNDDSQNSEVTTNIAQNLIGQNPYQIAQMQYEKTLAITEESLNKLEQESNQIDPSSQTPRQLLKQNITTNKLLINDLQTKLGIIYAYQDKLDLAQQSWQKITQTDNNKVLVDIWVNQKKSDIQLLEIVKTEFSGWFKNVNLAKIYAINNNAPELEQITNKQQEIAKKAVYNLLLLSFIPIVGGIIGFGLLVFLFIDWLQKKADSILVVNANQSWESPWDGEVIWQVLIVGFFFLSQVALPLLIGFSGFNPAGLEIKGKTLYVLVSYLLMAGGGLTVLYLSLKSFSPLSDEWFKLTNKNWYWWAIGGYLTAIPCVFLVSFFNQQIWSGRGGSNPLLLLTLESQDNFAIFILFITASIAAPIFEEIMFRGFLLPSLTRYLSVNGAIVVSALVFAIAHLSLAEIIPLMTLGIILGLVYTRSRSLLSSMIVHSLWNTGTLFTLFVLGSSLD